MTILNVFYRSLLLLLFGILGLACERASLFPADQVTDTALEERKNGATGHVFLIDNAVSGNNLIAFDRASDGSLSNRQSYATNGLGTGGGLGSQGAVVHQQQRLYVVNPGSDEVSVFSTNGQTIELLDIAFSGGTRPTSLTVHHNLLYVLNAGGTGNISGFEIASDGTLTPIDGSIRPTSGNGAAPAQISFDPSGNYLLVTERATNLIGVYPVDQDGLAGDGVFYPSEGATPFGFEFNNKGDLFVSEAFGGNANVSAVTSYSFEGNPSVVSPSVSTNQTAACWFVITQNGRYGYATNTGSGTVTGYRIQPDASISLLDEDGITGTSEAGPIDAGLSRNSNFLYTLNAGDESISIFEVKSNGSLENIGTVSDLPDGAAGLAAD